MSWNETAPLVPNKPYGRINAPSQLSHNAITRVDSFSYGDWIVAMRCITTHGFLEVGGIWRGGVVLSRTGSSEFGAGDGL